MKRKILYILTLCLSVVAMTACSGDKEKKKDSEEKVFDFGDDQQNDMSTTQLEFPDENGNKEKGAGKIERPAEKKDRQRNEESVAPAERPRNVVADGVRGRLLSSPAQDKNGKYIHSFTGYFTNGTTRWPIKIDYVEENGAIRSATYKNVKYKVESKMQVSYEGDEVVLRGKAHKSDFSIRLSPVSRGWSGNYYGSDNILEVFVEPS